MRYLSIVFVFVFAAVVSADPLFSTRPVDAIATETFDLAIGRSATVRSLVATLEASNVVVHIQSSRDLPDGIGGTTRFVASRSGYRYLRITIGAQLPLALRAAVLGHELQHACEVASSPASDTDSLRELFGRVGHRIGEYYETRAAINTERKVRLEMMAGLQAEPVVKFHH